jgi:GT2 family glycosyltransferase
MHKKKQEEKFLTYYFTGAAHLIKREVFKECGLYPTDFFYGMEEYDLSYRVLDKGYSIGYSNSITFLHKESPLGRKPKNEQIKMMWVNKCKVAFRYLPVKYFYTTAIMWSFEYLKKTGFDLKGWFKGWMQILRIQQTEERTPIKETALEYLKKVEARLWY